MRERALRSSKCWRRRLAKLERTGQAGLHVHGLEFSGGCLQMVRGPSALGGIAVQQQLSQVEADQSQLWSKANLLTDLERLLV